MSMPDRWLHLRHPEGFDQARFDAFCAFCRIWTKFVEATLEERKYILGLERGDVEYIFFDPILSADRKVASLPIGGTNTLGSRSHFENQHWRRAWENFPYPFLSDAQEGITEDIGHGPQTNWRPCLAPKSA